MVVVVAEEEEEIVVVNIVGSIRPEDLGVLGGQFGIPRNSSIEIARNWRILPSPNWWGEQLAE